MQAGSGKARTRRRLQIVGVAEDEAMVQFSRLSRLLADPLSHGEIDVHVQGHQRAVEAFGRDTE